MDLTQAQWRRSSRSGGGSGNACVEVAFIGPAVAVRDSKDPAGAVLAFSPKAWAAFLCGSRSSEWMSNGKPYTA